MTLLPVEIEKLPEVRALAELYARQAFGVQDEDLSRDPPTLAQEALAREIGVLVPGILALLRIPESPLCKDGLARLAWSKRTGQDGLALPRAPWIYPRGVNARVTGIWVMEILHPWGPQVVEIGLSPHFEPVWVAADILLGRTP